MKDALLNFLLNFNVSLKDAVLTCLCSSRTAEVDEINHSINKFHMYLI